VRIEMIDDVDEGPPGPDGRELLRIADQNKARGLRKGAAKRCELIFRQHR